jgi:hypothetical protein
MFTLSLPPAKQKASIPTPGYLKRSGRSAAIQLTKSKNYCRDGNRLNKRPLLKCFSIREELLFYRAWNCFAQLIADPFSSAIRGSADIYEYHERYY